MRRRIRPSGNVLTAVAVLGGVLASGATVWQASHAAFSSTTANGGNQWSAGTVHLTDDDSGGVMFNVSGLIPASTGERCIAVQYTGNLPASVRLYGSAVSGALAEYLDIVVEEGSVGGFSGCGSFAVTATPYTGTLTNFGTTRTNFGTGVGTFAPTGTATKVYRVRYTLNASTPSSAQGATAAATFTWEARNT